MICAERLGKPVAHVSLAPRAATRCRARWDDGLHRARRPPRTARCSARREEASVSDGARWRCYSADSVRQGDVRSWLKAITYTLMHSDELPLVASPTYACRTNFWPGRTCPQRRGHRQPPRRRRGNAQGAFGRLGPAEPPLRLVQADRAPRPRRQLVRSGRSLVSGGCRSAVGPARASQRSRLLSSGTPRPTHGAATRQTCWAQEPGRQEFAGYALCSIKLAAQVAGAGDPRRSAQRRIRAAPRLPRPRRAPRGPPPATHPASRSTRRRGCDARPRHRQASRRCWARAVTCGGTVASCQQCAWSTGSAATEGRCRAVPCMVWRARRG